MSNVRVSITVALMPDPSSIAMISTDSGSSVILSSPSIISASSSPFSVSMTIGFFVFNLL